MRKFRFFTERENLRVKSSVLLPEFEAQHIRKSLRLRKGDVVFLFNGEKEFEGVLTLVTKDAVMVKITKETAVKEESDSKVALFQGLSKVKSFETILEKATEVGVDEIIPFETEYSIIKADKVESKLDRWKKIIISASKQSERISIPTIFEAISFEDAVKHAKEEFDLVLFFTLRNDNNKGNFNSLSVLNESEGDHRVALFIGPEGGFSPAEETLALNAGFKFFELSENVLRAETAAIVAVSLIKFLTKNRQEPSK